MGPGVDSAIAIISRISSSEIHLFFSTLSLWIMEIKRMIAFINNLQPRYIDETRKTIIKNHMFGYNSGGYDKLMIAALLMYYNNTNNTKELIYKLYETSKHIISMQSNKDLARTDYLLNELIQKNNTSLS